MKLITINFNTALQGQGFRHLVLVNTNHFWYILPMSIVQILLVFLPKEYVRLSFETP